MPSQEPPQWRDWIEQGTAAFWKARYPEAVAAFQQAVDANPSSPIPHLYLALGWLQQFVPGAVSTDNTDYARRAETALRQVLNLDPENWTATVLLGMLARNEKQPQLAREWYQKAAALQPRNADTWCTLGALGWQQWFRQGKPEDGIEEAIANFEKCVALDPLHESAMQHLGFIHRERAGMRRSDEKRREDLAVAAEWMERAANARAEKVQAEIAQAVTVQPYGGEPDSFLKLSAWVAVTAPPPPPPPPPPPRMGGGLAFGGPGNEGTIVFEPQTQGAGQATPIRVPPAEQERKLITKVYPRSGSDAYGDDRLRFVVVIGKDGHIVREILIDGSSWLRRAAVEALGRWVYEPTLVNGEPVEVVTEVRVDFQAGE
jgi:cytochrome c-type biogenesis protein CcmH/NrfG